jgi:enolase
LEEINGQTGDKIQLVGDDLLLRTSNSASGNCRTRGQLHFDQGKLIGTLTETLATIDLAKKNHYATIISHLPAKPKTQRSLISP